MKYSFAFLTLGALTSYIAVTHGHWWHVLHWLSVSSFLQAAGYAGLGPRVFANAGTPDSVFESRASGPPS